MGSKRLFAFIIEGGGGLFGKIEFLGKWEVFLKKRGFSWKKKGFYGKLWFPGIYGRKMRFSWVFGQEFGKN